MNTKYNKSIELLAPAKNFEYGKTAILCGADAVYIGPKKFGARAKAGNSLNDIEKLIKFADQYYTSVYATINTLLFDEEIEAAVSLIHQLHQIGISGIIIQDMGLLEAPLPPIPIIASTQCFADTPEKVKFFQDLGFKRVILPRELSLRQVEKIRSHAKHVELEYFIHGALCVSYSGQCYMSYALGGRSGNRGNCAQPCRKQYSLYDAEGSLLIKNKHLLSLKDLDQSKHLEELINAGITSFKIEGRLKDENYIKNIITYYRREIDKILNKLNLQKSSSGISQVNFLPNPDKTFNRGFSDYFFSGTQKEIASIDTPKMRGEYIGKISSLGKDYFLIKSDIQLSNGDGISFFYGNDLKGTRLDKVKGKQIYPNNMQYLKNGLKIFRNFDHQFLKQLATAKIQRRVEINIHFFQNEDQYFMIVRDEDTNFFQMHIGSFEAAKNTKKSIQLIKESLYKTGNTIFICTDVKFSTPVIPFIKKSKINQIRRDLLSKLLKIRILNKSVCHAALTGEKVPYVADRLDFSGNVINEKSKSFYRNHGVKTIVPGIEISQDTKRNPLMRTKYCLRKELGQCLMDNQESNSTEWILKDEKANEFLLKFKCMSCEMEVVKK